jgi:hypothetical protein
MPFIAETALLTVFDGRSSIGFLMRRGKAGVEGFDINEHSVGLFPDEDKAASAVWRAAHNQTHNAFKPVSSKKEEIAPDEFSGNTLHRRL